MAPFVLDDTAESGPMKGGPEIEMLAFSRLCRAKGRAKLGHHRSNCRKAA